MKQGVSQQYRNLLPLTSASAVVTDKVIEKPEIIACAIPLGSPASWEEAVAARRENMGRELRI